MFKGKTAIITGAAVGIGRAVGMVLAEGGANVVLVDLDPETLATTEKEIKAITENVLAITCDVSDNEAVQETVKKANARFGKVDILVNNAGLAVGLGPIQEGVIDDWERMIDTNIKGLLYVSRKVLPWLVERKQGHVFNIASIAGKETYLNGNVYCATKTAVDSLSKAMSMDMVPYGIKVTNVAPGAVETEFSIVRFKGDQQRADNVYKGYEPLTGKDIADTIYYVATMPDHVCINDLIITPKAQASASIFHKE